MAIVGIARSYDIDFSPYLNDYGHEITARMQDASIANVFAQYAGLTWQQMMKPEYANPNSVPEYLEVVNKINMGTAPVPTIPMFIAQAANGILNGTLPGGLGTGPGDGVMVADDVAALATRYCDAGLSIQYDQYDTIEHGIGGALWLPGALLWLTNRFNGTPHRATAETSPPETPLPHSSPQPPAARHRPHLPGRNRRPDYNSATSASADNGTGQPENHSTNSPAAFM